MNSINQEPITRAEFEEFRNDILKLQEEIAAVTKSTANAHKGLHVLARDIDALANATIFKVDEIFERIKGVEATVFPGIGKSMQALNEIIKPTDWVDPELPPPPAAKKE